MSRGRPPKPIEQHIIDGTARHDRHAERAKAEVVVIGTEPKPYGELSEKVQAIWDRIVDENLMLTVSDSTTLQVYCELFSEFLDYSVAHAHGGKSMPAERLNALRQYGSLLGLDPIGRARRGVEVGKKYAKPASGTSKFFD